MIEGLSGRIGCISWRSPKCALTCRAGVLGLEITHQINRSENWVQMHVSGENGENCESGLGQQVRKVFFNVHVDRSFAFKMRDDHFTL